METIRYRRIELHDWDEIRLLVMWSAACAKSLNRDHAVPITWQTTLSCVVMNASKSVDNTYQATTRRWRPGAERTGNRGRKARRRTARKWLRLKGREYLGYRGSPRPAESASTATCSAPSQGNPDGKEGRSGSRFAVIRCLCHALERQTKWSHRARVDDYLRYHRLQGTSPPALQPTQRSRSAAVPCFYRLCCLWP